MGELADLLDPRLVLKRDLEAASAPKLEPRRLKPKRLAKADQPPTHVVIPDNQIKPGVPTAHVEWVGCYIADALGDRENVEIIDLGDFWDLASLSSYDKGKRQMEGRRLAADLLAGNKAFARRDAVLPKKKSWRKRILRGNHELRLQRMIDLDAQLEGLISMDLLDTLDWEVHDFLDVVWLDGVAYSHYFYQPNTGRPYGGENLGLRLKTIGHSFTMGHQQGLLYSVRATTNGMQHGLVCGSCYTHDEEYRGPQAQDHWRGIVVCNQVENGTYDPLFVSLDYLCRKYEGIRLSEFRAKYVDAA